MEPTQTETRQPMTPMGINSGDGPYDSYAVTGTYHGSIIYARSEGDARRAFHKAWNGESITHVKKHKGFVYP